MTALDQQGAAAHRARYLALQAAASERANASSPRSPKRALDADSILHQKTIPGGWYWSVPLSVGRGVRIVNASGRAAVSLQIWNALEPGERFNAGDTMKLQWSTQIETDRLLFSDMGRVLASVTDEQAGGRHDMLTGASDAVSTLERYSRAGLRDTRNNFLLAATKLGLSRRDIHPCLTLFAGVGVDEGGALNWIGGGHPSEYIQLRAELPLLVTFSNCPHPLDPSPDYDPGDVEVFVIERCDIGEIEVCRTSCEEAVRGFENTRNWLAMTRSMV